MTTTFTKHFKFDNEIKNQRFMLGLLHSRHRLNINI